jgi:hypothetical protein
MEQDKINQLNAAKTTVDYCEATAAETAANTAFAPKVAVIKGKIVVVEGFIQLSEQPITGVTLNVKAIRAVAIENVLPLGSAVFAYAATQTPPDQDLMALAKLTKTDLEQTSKEECFTECQRIVALANANSANILPLGITALMLTDAGAAVTLYGTVINSPRAAVISRASAGEQAEDTLASIMNVDLKLHLDPMADIFRFTKNVWWKNYRRSREVIDLGTTFTKLRVNAVDIESDPIKDVLVSLLQAGEVKYTGKTKADGELSIVKIDPGNYDIKYEKTGFITQIEADYHCAPGSEKIHHIVMNETAASGGDPAGFEIQELHIPGGASMQIPVGAPINPAMVLYLFAVNGNITVCTTMIPASPCVVGYNLQQATPFQGPVSGLNIDLNNSHFQFTNPGANEVTLKVGTQI